MTILRKEEIKSPEGKLAILTPGMGAVATTLMAGVLAVRKGVAKPIGSLTQMSTIRLGKRTDNNSPLINDFLPIAKLDQVVFGGWDIFEDNAYEAAANAAVLDKEDLDKVKDELSAIKPMKAVFDTSYIKLIDGPNKKTGTKWEKAQALREDVRSFIKDNGCTRAVAIWCASTEVYREPTVDHQTIEAFEAGLKEDHPDIAPSQIYAYAFLKENVPFGNGAPNLCMELPCLMELGKQNRVPYGGKDFKTGQTLMKTILAVSG